MNDEVFADVAPKDDHCAERKAIVCEKLDKSRREMQEINKARLEKHENVENVKKVESFRQNFAKSVDEIKLHLQKIDEVAADSKLTEGNATEAELMRMFSDVKLKIQELQTIFNTNVDFLVDYKVKMCQIALNNLHKQCEKMRLQLLPTKKFAFSRKTVPPEIMVDSKVSAANDKTKTAQKKQSALSAKFHEITLTLANRNQEYICLDANEVNGRNITISDLKNCFVELRGHANSVQIAKAEDCTLLCGPVSRSFFAEHCQRTTLAVACQQLRLHSSNACRIFLHATSRAVIEDCTQIDFADYNYSYAAIVSDFELAGLDSTVNNYADVADFNWLSSSVPSPHFNVLKNQPEPDWAELVQSFKLMTLSHPANSCKDM